jgi:hypothetical protein
VSWSITLALYTVYFPPICVDLVRHRRDRGANCDLEHFLSCSVSVRIENLENCRTNYASVHRYRYYVLSWHTWQNSWFRHRNIHGILTDLVSTLPATTRSGAIFNLDESHVINVTMTLRTKIKVLSLFSDRTENVWVTLAKFQLQSMKFTTCVTDNRWRQYCLHTIFSSWKSIFGYWQFSTLPGSSISFAIVTLKHRRMPVTLAFFELYLI